MAGRLEYGPPHRMAEYYLPTEAIEGVELNTERSSAHRII